LILAGTLFTSALVSCSGSPDRLPIDVLTPVDCTHLPFAPEELVDATTESDSVRLDADLDVGTGQLLLGWSDGSGAHEWFLPIPTRESRIVFGQGVDDLLVWDIRIKLPCLPESAVNVQLTREGEAAPLTPGTYPLVSVSVDVPEREQGVDLDSMEVSGEVVITSAADDLVSGYMQGRGAGMLKSHFTQEHLGVRYEIAAMQFEQIDGDFVAK
jgi:hypothetical protein